MGERIGYTGPGKTGPGLPEVLLEDGREACGFDVDEGKAGEQGDRVFCGGVSSLFPGFAESAAGGEVSKITPPLSGC